MDRRQNHFLLPRLLATTLVAALVGGCAALSFARPDVSLVDLKFTDLTVFETSGVFIVRLSNENPRPLQLDGGVYNLYLGGLKVGKGFSRQPVEIPALGTTTDEIEFHLSNLALASRLREMIASREVDYRIKAKVYLDGGLGRRSVKLERTGRFDFEDTPFSGRKRDLEEDTVLPVEVGGGGR